MSKSVMLASIACAAFLTAAGCAMPMKPMQDAPLYGRLGGKPAITAVVDDFIGNVAGDARVNKRFAAADTSEFLKF